MAVTQDESGSSEPQGGGSPAPRGLTQRAIGGMFWTFSGTGVQVGVQILAIMALGRLLTPEEFGLMGAATVIIGCSQIVSQVGVGPAIIQRRELEPVHIRVAVTLSGVLGLLLGALVYFGAAEIAAFYRMPELEPVLRAISFLFPMDGLNTVAKAILTRELRFRLYIALDVLAYVLGYALVGVVLAWLGYGVWALVWANLMQLGVRLVAMYIATRHSLRPSVNWRAARDLLRFGFGHSMAQIGTLLSQQGDNLVVGRWLGAEALGVYGRAYNLMVMPAQAFGRIINRVLFPVMSQVQDAPARLANGYERALAIVAFISLPLSAFLWVVAPEFIGLVLGPKWGGGRAAVPALQHQSALPHEHEDQRCLHQGGRRGLSPRHPAVRLCRPGGHWRHHRPALGRRRCRGSGLDRDGHHLAEHGLAGEAGDGAVLAPVLRRASARRRPRGGDGGDRGRGGALGAGGAPGRNLRARDVGTGGDRGGDRRVQAAPECVPGTPWQLGRGARRESHTARPGPSQRCPPRARPGRRARFRRRGQPGVMR